MTDFERRVTFRPAFDRCAHDPSKNYGIHGVEVLFLLLGPKGATQFLLYTNWMLPAGNCPIGLDHTRRGSDHRLFCDPMPADLGYHSPSPRYEDQSSYECDVLPAGRCHYDGSSLNAVRVYQRLLREGSDGVWAELESFYRSLFEEAA